MPSKHKLSSTLRRRAAADTLFSTGLIAMRACAPCVRASCLCVVSPADQRCEQCVRHGRLCDLAAPLAEIERLSVQENKLLEEIAASDAKTRRLRKQRKQLLKRMRSLGDREAQNIAELEIDEMMEDTSFPDPLGPSGVSTPRATAPSPRPFSSIDDALQDSQRRTPASPVGSG